MYANPWQAVHEEDDGHYTGEGYTRAMSRAATAAEYAGLDQAYTCGSCGSQRAFFRAAVGAVMCTACHAVRRVRIVDGERVERWI